MHVMDVYTFMKQNNDRCMFLFKDNNRNSRPSFNHKSRIANAEDDIYMVEPDDANELKK